MAIEIGWAQLCAATQGFTRKNSYKFKHMGTEFCVWQKKGKAITSIYLQARENLEKHNRLKITENTQDGLFIDRANYKKINSETSEAASEHDCRLLFDSLCDSFAFDAN